jgi:hypothetical protein
VQNSWRCTKLASEPLFHAETHHAGVIPWAREKVGNSVPGWKSFGSWSLAPEGAESSYLFDEHARIRTGDKDESDDISAIEGINKIREVLSRPGRVVRRPPGLVNDVVPLGSCRVELTEKLRNRVAASGHVLGKSFLVQTDFLRGRELAQFFGRSASGAGHLLGSKFDQIVQHARAQSDLTYCDQMVVIEGQPEGVPALCFPVLLAGPAHGLFPVFATH